MPPGEHLAPYADSIRYYNDRFINKRKQSIYCYYWKPMVNPRLIAVSISSFRLIMDSILMTLQWESRGMKTAASAFVYLIASFDAAEIQANECVKYFRYILALLHISHGFTEHCMMYEALATEMARRGFFVFAHDHAGHGHSDGDRGYVEDMYDLVDDSLQHIQMVREEFPHIPLFICGHSMGGTVATLSSLRSEVDVSGVVLIAPAFASNPETATFFRVIFAKFMSKYFPHLPIASTDFSLSCQNDTKVQEMNNDPLRYKGYWKVRPVVCLLQSGEEILSKTSEVKFPFLVLHGDSDKICHLRGAQEFYEHSASEDKTLKIYPGAYHSLLNEPKEIADDVFNQTIQWILERV